MTKGNEREREVKPAGEVRESAETARPRLRTRVVSEAVVGAIPAAEEADPEGRADDGDGAGA